MEELELDPEDRRLICMALIYFAGNSVLSEDMTDRLWELIGMFENTF